MLIIINWLELYSMYNASAISGAASEPRYVISEFNAIITHQEQQTQGWGETE